MKEKMSDFTKEFKQFVLRGTAVDLGVALAIATTLVIFVRATIEDWITPIITMIFGESQFSSLSFTINHSRFRYGDWLNDAFVLIAVVAVAFFFVVRPINAARAKQINEPLEDPSIRICAECLSEVPAKSTRCKFCTATA